MGHVHPTASVASSAVLTGDVTLGPGSRVLHGAVLPIGWIAAGDPAQLFSPDRHDELWAVQSSLDFVGSVYGLPRGSSMREIMRRQSEAFAPHEPS